MYDYCKIKKNLNVHQTMRVLMFGGQPESLHFETSFCMVPTCIIDGNVRIWAA